MSGIRSSLGAQQFLGVGTEIDVDSAAANLLMASLSGSNEARKLFSDIVKCLTPAVWEHVADRVQWANLIILVGPTVEGHLTGLSDLPGSAWIDYEREFAEGLFMAKESLLDAAFCAPVIVTKIFVGETRVGNERVASTTINLRNVQQVSGLPIWWNPDERAMDALTAAVSFLGARKWARWSYVSF
jgi:hypothetical protein